ncbi:hypothetical protein N7449_000225 [Penicillium cf. viridicatum]|uniref:Carboxylesterase type B domain-containing protein n=1 Tax=Penicillium cf. viridicatum TaxID=2972119 RepID=A0A9W9N4J2_9EURO|nr:hypothetical protein N7449_000225 [Penicillium cf. viridicatum]
MRQYEMLVHVWKGEYRANLRTRTGNEDTCEIMRGATHGSEVFYALGNLYAQSSSYSEADYEVSEKMSSYWANFVKTRNPNKGGSSTNGTLPWGANVPSQNSQFDLGTSWKKIPIASSIEEKEVLLKYFKLATPSPY